MTAMLTTFGSRVAVMRRVRRVTQRGLPEPPPSTVATLSGWAECPEIRLSTLAAPHYVAEVDLFSLTWTALRTTVAGLSDEDFGRPSGCTGWLVRDLVCHLVIDAQDVLITLATPSHGQPTRDALTYWEVSGTPPTGDDPLDALTVRLAAAYEDPHLLRFHLDDVGSAAGRAALLADPAGRVGTRDEILTVADYLSAYVLEWTLHHLDLIAYLPGAEQPPAEGLTRSREMLEQIAGGSFPASFQDVDALLIGTGRRAPAGAEQDALGELASRLPLYLG
jgi:hypothetical protein